MLFLKESTIKFLFLFATNFITENSLCFGNFAFVTNCRTYRLEQNLRKKKENRNAYHQQNLCPVAGVKFKKKTSLFWKQQQLLLMSEKHEGFSSEPADSDNTTIEGLTDLSLTVDENEKSPPMDVSERTGQDDKFIVQKNSDFEPTYTCGGSIIARVVPRIFGQYEVQKPLSQSLSTDEICTLVCSYRQTTAEPYEKRHLEFTQSEEQICNQNSFISIWDDFDNVDLSELSVMINLDLRLTHFDANLCTKNNKCIASNQPRNKHEVMNVRVQMDRDADETALRTLYRLEISAAKRVQNTLKRFETKQRQLITDNPNMHHTKATALSPKNKKKQNGLKNTQKLNSFLFVHESFDESVTENDSNTNFANDKIDISNLKSIDLWNKIANITNHNAQKVGLCLACPNDLKKLLNVTVKSENMSFINMNVISCPPTILSVKTFENFKAQVFDGIPMVVELELLFATHATVTWFADGEVRVRNSTQYTPTQNDIGKEISILIVPYNEIHNGTGCEEAYRFLHRVRPVPFMPILSSIRNQWIEQKHQLRENLRVMTYNILADIYTARDKDEQVIHCHCDPQHLTRFRRMPMLVSEILAYNADIICLQEVDASIFESLLNPVLKAKGYQGYYCAKASAQSEGCAMFWSLEYFEIAKDDDMLGFNLRDLIYDKENSVENRGGRIKENIECSLLQTDSGLSKKNAAAEWKESMRSIHELLNEHDELRKVICEKTGQILQVATLTLRTDKHIQSEEFDKDNRKPIQLMLANTHLFYHPMADHVRAIQTFVVCKKLDEMRLTPTIPSSLPLVLCGDLNSDPLSGAMQLLFHRKIPKHHDCWNHLDDYSWEINNETNENIIDKVDFNLSPTKTPSFRRPSFALPKCFPNLLSGYSKIPKFTNYVSGFVETLDYIFVSEVSDTDRLGFQPISSAPMPSEDDVKPYIAMPNEAMPSDHVSVICDIQWKVK